MKDDILKGTSKLRPRANIIHILGDELISSDTVAVTELVKNAYDADATEVIIRFRGKIENGEGEIDIIDNGTGMAFETVTSGWLEPATQIKKKSRITSKGRRVLGEKGVGRFAAARLASKMEMITRQAASDREITVIFDWGAFDRTGYLDEIECNWEQRKPLLVTAHGTILHLTGLKNKWSVIQIEELRNSLARIISPFEKIKDFTINLELPEDFTHLAGAITPSELLTHPDYIIRGKVENDGAYDLKYVGNAGKKEILRNRFGRSKTFGCGPFDIELRVWDRDRPSIQKLADVFQRKPEEVRKELDKSAGIYVYRDEFRVFPYGEPNNDWLRLDLRRVQNPTLRVSNNQVVGCILISLDRNPDLKDQTNREGIIASQAFEEMKELVREVLNQLEIRRYKERRKEKPAATTKGGIFQGFNLEPVRDAIQQKYPADKQIIQVVEEQEKDLTGRIETVQEVLARYVRLATLGQLIDIVLHDGRTPLNKISNEAALGIEGIDKHAGQSTILDSLKKRFAFILEQGKVLSQLFKKIEPFGGRKRGRPEKTTVEEIVAETFEIFDADIRKLGIKCELPVSKTDVTLDQVEIQEVLVNLLKNSLYWLEKFTEEGKRVIRVDVRRSPSGEVVILFCDSGPGVAKEYREHIFEPYFSTKPDGVGLGLSIAGEIVAEYDGDLALVDGPLSGACFRITLRRRV